MQINLDYKEYVGGEFDLMSDWQMNFLTNHVKITPDTKILDIGCGSMRLGRKLIPYLNANCYTGLDRCQEIVEAGIKNELPVGVLADKQPKFIYTTDFDLNGCDVVDVIWASAVFNHLKPDSIRNCLEQLNNVYNKHTVFYFTYWPAVQDAKTDWKASDVYNGISKRNFFHSQHDIMKMLTEYGWYGTQLIEKQCRGQSIVKAVRV